MMKRKDMSVINAFQVILSINGNQQKSFFFLACLLRVIFVTVESNVTHVCCILIQNHCLKGTLQCPMPILWEEQCGWQEMHFLNCLFCQSEHGNMTTTFCCDCQRHQHHRNVNANPLQHMAFSNISANSLGCSSGLLCHIPHVHCWATWPCV